MYPQSGEPTEQPAGTASTGRTVRSRRLGTKLGLVGIGLVAGAVGATAATASAATNPSPSSTASSGTGSSSAPYGSSSSGSGSAPAPDQAGGGPHGGALDMTGSVTAVGSSSVTIKTSSGTTTYAVTSSSDIDKNGEAQLSDLKPGDAVRFGVTTSNGTTAIDKLHAGDENLDRPSGAPGSGSKPTG